MTIPGEAAFLKSLGEAALLKGPGEVALLRSPGEVALLKGPGEAALLKSPGEVVLLKGLGEAALLKSPGEDALLRSPVDGAGLVTQAVVFDGDSREEMHGRERRTNKNKSRACDSSVAPRLVPSMAAAAAEEDGGDDRRSCSEVTDLKLMDQLSPRYHVNIVSVSAFSLV